MNQIASRVGSNRASYIENIAFACQALDEWGFTPREKAAAFGVKIDSNREWDLAQWRMTQCVHPKIERCAQMISDIKCRLALILTPEEQKEWMVHKQPYLEDKSVRELLLAGPSGVAEAFTTVKMVMGELEVPPEAHAAAIKIKTLAAIIADNRNANGIIWQI